AAAFFQANARIPVWLRRRPRGRRVLQSRYGCRQFPGREVSLFANRTPAAGFVAFTRLHFAPCISLREMNARYAGRRNDCIERTLAAGPDAWESGSVAIRVLSRSYL